MKEVGERELERPELSVRPPDVSGLPGVRFHN